MNSTPKWLTATELAVEINMSVGTIRRNIRRYGEMAGVKWQWFGASRRYQISSTKGEQNEHHGRTGTDD